MQSHKRDTLQVIGARCHTDKASHRFEGWTYLHIYDIYMRGFCDRPMKILELGIKRGASHRMWKQYFPQGEVFGLDLDPKCRQYEEPRIHIYTGHQDDTACLDKIVRDAGGGFDIILDDCSHLNVLTVASLKHLWQYVNPGGYYIIEDLRNSYTKDMKKEMARGKWDARNKQSKSTKLENHREDMDKVFQHYVRQLDFRVGDKRFVHFWPMICIIGKV